METLQPVDEKQYGSMINGNFFYIIPLKHSYYKLSNIVSILLCFFTLIPFTYLLLVDGRKPATYIVSIIVILVQFAVNYYKAKKGKSFNHNYAFAVCFIAWLNIHYSNWLIACLYLIALIVETQVKSSHEIGVNEGGITINSFPKKKFSWNDFVNVIIKDNMLTIDFKNNRILQKETDVDVPADLEKEFNDFCKNRINQLPPVAHS